MALNIRPMGMEVLAFAAECTRAEGWVSENLDTLESFFFKDSESCLVEKEDGKQAGICIATDYGRYGFIGELIVRPEVRGRGIGVTLLKSESYLLTLPSR